MMGIDRRLCAAALIGMTMVGTWRLHAQVEDTLAIAGDVSKPMTLTAADLKAMPRTTVSLMD
ncbi:MAG TPA: hypothetical protein VKB36_15735, partial [Vicinamibacterales bacterium]|nr:hypothetical protein [Vicinamibacterales bacterium]